MDQQEMPETQFSFRSLQASDLPFFKEMFYLSLHVPEGEAPFPRSIIDQPGLAKYHQNWGRPSDVGIIATNKGEEVGACWSRFFLISENSYGFVDEQTPEIGIAIKEKFRGQGLGTSLLLKLLQALKNKGVPAASLSVDKRNRAVNLYRRIGFEFYEEAGTAITMLKKL